MMAAWEAEKGPFDPTKTWLQNALLGNIHHRSDTARKFYFHGPLVDVPAATDHDRLPGQRGTTQHLDRGQEHVQVDVEHPSRVSRDHPEIVPRSAGPSRP